MMFEKTIALNEFITLQRGFDLPKDDRINGNVPVVASTGVGGYHNEAKVEAPGVVIGRSGSIGGGQFITENFWPLNTTLWVKDFKGHSPRYVYYLLKSIDFKRFNVGSGVPTLNRNHLSSVLVSDIGINTEKKIAKILGNLDDKIALNRQINQTLESMAQALFKSWFVDFEPVKAKIAAIEAGEDAEGVTRAAIRAISGKTDDELDQMQAGQPENYAQLKTTAGLFPSAMQDSELGGVPKGWGLKPLYETAEYVNGAAFKAKYFSDNRSGLPIIKIAELKQGISSGTKYTNENVKKKYFIDNDDVLYSWSGSPETSLEVFKWFGGKGYLNQHIFKLNFENSQQKYFAYFLLQHMKPLLIRTAQQKQTTGLGHVTVADMKRMLVVYPDNQTLTRFSEVVGSIYEQNSILQRENSKLVALRDTLLPKLLSGELSVDAIEMARGKNK